MHIWAALWDLDAELELLGVHNLHVPGGGTKVMYLDRDGVLRGSDFVETEDSLDDAKAAYVAARTELGKAMTQAVVEASTDADIKDADGNPMTPEDFVKEAKAAACQFKGSC